MCVARGKRRRHSRSHYGRTDLVKVVSSLSKLAEVREDGVAGTTKAGLQSLQNTQEVGRCPTDFARGRGAVGPETTQTSVLEKGTKKMRRKRKATGRRKGNDLGEELAQS